MAGLPFVKMQGLGNDYVYLDLFDPEVVARLGRADRPELARRLSDRHAGIGADGLILVLPHPDADARMEMYNADGSRAEMCGNGLRCVARLLHSHARASRTALRIATDSGVREAWVQAGGSVTIDLGPPRLDAREIPLSESVPSPVLRHRVEVDGETLELCCLSMGNPHAVTFVASAAAAPVARLGPRVERHALFPQRTNVEFVEVLGPGRLRQRTWERGSGETQACGTGAGAVCVAANLCGVVRSRQVEIELLGGVATVEWRTLDDHVHLTGPAVESFRGVYWL